MTRELFTNPDHDVLHGALNGYATAFFGSMLLGDGEMAEYLVGEHFSGLVVRDE